MIVIDNCCQVRNAITKAIPTASVILDVYHFIKRCESVSHSGFEHVKHAAIVSFPHNVVMYACLALVKCMGNFRDTHLLLDMLQQSSMGPKTHFEALWQKILLIQSYTQ